MTSAREIVDRLNELLSENYEPKLDAEWDKFLVEQIEAYAVKRERGVWERAAKLADDKAELLRKAAHVVQQPTAEALRMAELAIVSVEDLARAIRAAAEGST